VKQVKVLVIGAGPTGLGAAYQLNRHDGVDWLLCEQSSEVGGLSRSIVDEAGYTWDIGGHVWFSHFDVFSNLLVKLLGVDGYIEHRRDAAIRCCDSWVPYPFQDHLQALPGEVRSECLAGLVEAALASASGATAPPENFAEFITATFGSGIAEAFMRPYNEKVWAYALEDMSWSWTGERVSVPDPATAVRNTLGDSKDTEWGPNASFVYPKSGGTGAFWRALADTLPPERLRLGTRAISIDRENKIATFEDGTEVGYEYLITTAPLDVTARLIGDPALIELTSRLEHSSVHVIGLGVDASVGERLGNRCWMYFPDPELPFYRVTHFSHYSPANVPQGVDGASLLVEVAESASKPVAADGLADHVIAGLVSAGVLESAGQVTHVWTHRTEHGYPTPTLNRDEIVNKALAALGSANIFSRGRFGAWRYEVGNMDHSFMQGYEAAARALTGCAELTVWHPTLTNSRHPALGLGRYR
jgi:protoporphyrinogen oxidase